jgi:hypothetical protein
MALVAIIIVAGRVRLYRTLAQGYAPLAAGGYRRLTPRYPSRRFSELCDVSNEGSPFGVSRIGRGDRDSFGLVSHAAQNGKHHAHLGRLLRPSSQSDGFYLNGSWACVATHKCAQEKAWLQESYVSKLAIRGASAAGPGIRKCGVVSGPWRNLA